METEDQKESFDFILKNDAEINHQFDQIIKAKDLESVMTTMRRVSANKLRNTTVHLINELIDDINAKQSIAIERTSQSINSSIIILIVTNVTAIASGVVIMLLISWAIITTPLAIAVTFEAVSLLCY